MERRRENEDETETAVSREGHRSSRISSAARRGQRIMSQRKREQPIKRIEGPSSKKLVGCRGCKAKRFVLFPFLWY